MEETLEDESVLPDAIDCLPFIIVILYLRGEMEGMLGERLSWTYEYPDAPKHFAKTTVSEMKRLSERESHRGRNGISIWSRDLLVME